MLKPYKSIIYECGIGKTALLLYLLFILSPASLWGQGTIKVTGVVLDEQREPLAGASILVKGTTTGTQAGLDGSFMLSNVPSKATLLVSFVGMQTQEVSPSGKSKLEIILKSDATLLEDLVVVGYGTQRKVNLTGSVASVDKKQLEARPIQNLSHGLQGAVPGLSISGTNGAPGLDGGSIHIRGTGTLNGSSPYILIDGVEGGTFNAIDPNDVESISVLKDASSATIYGSKAANGVILITTKRGKKGKVQVSYSGYTSIQTATNLIERMGSYEYASLYNNLLAEQGRAKAFTDDELEKFRLGNDEAYPDTDWYGLAFKQGLQHRHNVTASGGNDLVRYMASLGYLGQTGILPGAERQQANARTNLDIQLSKRWTAKIGLAFIKNKYSDPSSAYAGGGNDQIIRQLNVIAPWIPNRKADGSYGTVSDGNPIAWLDADIRVWRDNRNFTGNVSLSYEPIDGLKLTATGSYVNNLQHYNYFQKFIQYNPNKATEPNRNRDHYAGWERRNFDFLTNYTKSLGKHNLSALLGASSESFHYHILEGFRSNFPNNEVSDLNAGDASTQTNGGFTRDLRILSYFGRLNYDYDGKYLFEANLRADASSRFAKGHRWGYFPSFSMAWRLTKEEFMKGVLPWLTDLKIRASWGRLGNQDALDDYYPAIVTYRTDATYPFGGSLETGYYQREHKLQSISWERATTWGLGLDLALFDNRLTASLDYYVRRTDGMLMQVSVPREFALNPYRDNVGAIDNQGLELSLGYRQNWKDWSFGVSANLAYNKNKVVYLGENTDYINSHNSLRHAVGYPLSTYYVYKTDGFLQSDAEAKAYQDKYGKPFGKDFRAGDLRYVDTNGDGKINGEDRVYAGSATPAYAFGLNLNASYKAFDLQLMFNGVAQVYKYFSGEAYGEFAGDTGHPGVVWRDAWRPDNPNASMPRIYLKGQSVNEQMSTFWLQNTSYIRLKNLQLGYHLPKRFASRLGLSSLRLFYSVENLFTIDGMKLKIDPETTGTRLSSYPLLRTHALGINISF